MTSGKVSVVGRNVECRMQNEECNLLHQLSTATIDLHTSHLPLATWQVVDAAAQQKVHNAGLFYIFLFIEFHSWLHVLLLIHTHSNLSTVHCFFTLHCHWSVKIDLVVDLFLQQYKSLTSYAARDAMTGNQAYNAVSTRQVLNILQIYEQTYVYKLKYILLLPLYYFFTV